MHGLGSGVTTQEVSDSLDRPSQRVFHIFVGGVEGISSGVSSGGDCCVRLSIAGRESAECCIADRDGGLYRTLGRIGPGDVGRGKVLKPGHWRGLKI